jgi:hypothetical protein
LLAAYMHNAQRQRLSVSWLFVRMLRDCVTSANVT